MKLRKMVGIDAQCALVCRASEPLLEFAQRFLELTPPSAERST